MKILFIQRALTFVRLFSENISEIIAKKDRFSRKYVPGMFVWDVFGAVSIPTVLLHVVHILALATRSMFA